MRKLSMTAALAFAALSWAHQARADETTKTETKTEIKEDARGAQESVERGAASARDTARAESDQARNDVQDGRSRQDAQAEGARASAHEKKHPLFGDKSNFDLEGKVQKVSEGSITVQREELPPATLKVSKSTKIELDGEAASVKQLRPGQDVKASFNLRGDKPEAVEIKAKKSDQQKDAEKSRSR